MSVRPGHRTLRALACGTLALLALVGCASTSTTTTDSTAGPAEVVYGGDRLTGVEVAGDPGREPEVTIAEPAELTGDETDIQREVVVEGAGAPLTEDDTVVVIVGSYYAEDGDALSAYSSLGPATQLSNPELPAFVKPLFVGIADGSRVVASVPFELVAGEGTQGDPVLMVADVVKVEPGVSADGQPTGETFDYATVSATAGEPEVTINTDAADPTEQQTITVLQGDGETVADGDTAIVQYSGYLLADGSRFDTSWDAGLPPAFPTSMVVTGFRDALVGSQVGSRIVTVFPSDLGYGDEDYGPIPGGSTLVFVADIVALV
ncbi:FKBP-type peptidyl-prolyl cis-trans isomerase [Gulosibacter faecalis]|uniref:Peptidyl-prolyl cis-trans isomerase n=1 Tax=Gulosibacter faecalis TaxID=272240 RepID=A0ABW5UY64_9MICO|nr:FKBP-type peptidyl-prolyl cis-trans isomerase [Gulosibacter faecalis]